MQRVALALYSALRRTRLLDTRAGDALFTRAYFAYKRLFEDPFAKLASAAPGLFAGGDIIDVGANIGYTTAVFAPMLSDGCSLYAFEPEAENYRRLTRTVARLRNRARVECVQSAAGDRDTEALLWRNEQHHADHRIITGAFHPAGASEQRVAMTTIDRFVASRGNRPLAFVKIDVQGFEPAVLRGMSRVIAANPTLSIALEMAPAQLQDLGFANSETIDPLVDAGFVPHLLTRHGIVRVDPAQIVAATQPRGYIDVLWNRGLPLRQR